MAKVDKDAVIAYVDAQSGFPNVTDPGYYIMEGTVSVDENGVSHESGHVPTQRVYPVGDGKYDTYPGGEE